MSQKGGDLTGGYWRQSLFGEECVSVMRSARRRNAKNKQAVLSQQKKNLPKIAYLHLDSAHTSSAMRPFLKTITCTKGQQEASCSPKRRSDSKRLRKRDSERGN